MNTKESNLKSYAKAKERIFTIRLDDEQKSRLSEKSKKTGLSKAALIRATLDGIIIKPKNDKLTQDVLKEMSAWGNNLNQLAKIANEAVKAGQLRPDNLYAHLDAIKNELIAIKERL